MPPPPRSSSARRSAALDGLRAVAALSVFGFHAWLYTLPVVRAAAGRDTLPGAIFAELRIGLVLFFVLSGFLLFRPWAAARRDRGRAPRTGTYALHRLARIVPAYYLAILGSVVLLWPLAGEPGVRLPPAGLLWVFGIFAQNLSPQTALTLDPPMWTLAVEAAFYLVLPVLGWLALRGGPGRARLALVPCAAIAGGLLFNALVARQEIPAQALAKSLPAMLPYFALGMLAAVLADARTPSRRLAWALLAAGGALVLADGWLHAHAVAGGELALRLRIVRDLPAAAGFAAIVAVAATRPPRALAWAPLAWVGTISYGLYLWHVPVLLVLRADGLMPVSPLGAFAVALPVSLLLGWLSWRFVEAPAIAWSRRRRISRPALRTPRTAPAHAHSSVSASRPSAPLSAARRPARD
ncbi:MAG TPA: acyltransferase [Solirubrobacteraceae bacterium]|nr:acyltransferase [Solirubrobacteraceae bacterium]